MFSVSELIYRSRRCSTRRPVSQDGDGRVRDVSVYMRAKPQLRARDEYWRPMSPNDAGTESASREKKARRSLWWLLLGVLSSALRRPETPERGFTKALFSLFLVCGALGTTSAGGASPTRPRLAMSAGPRAARVRHVSRRGPSVPLSCRACHGVFPGADRMQTSSVGRRRACRPLPVRMGRPAASVTPRARSRHGAP